MPNSWEGLNLTHNLTVLGRLAGRPVGAKLKYDSDTGKFDIDDRHVFSRTFSWDSVTSRTHFSTPMVALMKKAHELLGSGAVAQDVFDAAMAGLAKLRSTYAGSPDKLQAIENVLKEVDGLAPLAREASDRGEIVVALRRKYQTQLVHAIRQRNYLDTGQGDICRALVIDWGRLALANNFAYIRRDAHAGAFAPLSLSRVEHAQMQPIVNCVEPLQREEEARLKAKKPLRTSFPDHVRFGRVRLSDPGYDPSESFARSARGADLFRSILHESRQFGNSRSGDRAMLVQFDGPKRSDSHMMGLHLYGEGLAHVHLFDPNVGEFRFMSGAEDPFARFCNDLMDQLYSNAEGLIFNEWSVSRLTVRG